MPPYFFLATKLENDDTTSFEIIKQCMRLGSNFLYEELFPLKVLTSSHSRHNSSSSDSAPRTHLYLSMIHLLKSITSWKALFARSRNRSMTSVAAMNDVLKPPPANVSPSLISVNVPNYLKSFSWDDSKYSRSKTLIEIVAIIKERMNENEAEIRKMLHVYSDTKNQLQALTKKEGGNFITRDIGDIVYENDIPPTSFVDTDHFTTLVAVVHKKQAVDWITNYELLVDKDVVPDSSE